MKHLCKINMNLDCHNIDDDDIGSQHHTDALRKIGMMCESRISDWLIMDNELELFYLQQGLNENITIIHSESCCFIAWMYIEL